MVVLTLVSYCRAPAAEPDTKVLRAGIIGVDTSHALVFAKTFNDPKAAGDIAGIRVVAAFPGGSPDIASSRDRVGKHTDELRAMGVQITDSIPTLLQQVDVVMLESVDGRPHLEQARAAFEAGKPMFIDKPLAGSLADSVAIAALGAKYHTPWFSSSALRFGPSVRKALADPELGTVVGCDAWSPSPLEPHHPDFFWYGVHGIELLYTVMGPGCESVTRTQGDGVDCVVGRWKDGRVGSFRGLRVGKQDYGAVIFGSKKISTVSGFEGYEPLVEQIALFFKTRKPPVNATDTLELLTFMEAADESKRQQGRPVEIETVLKKAQEEAASKSQAGDHSK